MSIAPSILKNFSFSEKLYFGLLKRVAWMLIGLILSPGISLLVRRIAFLSL
jgi:hypothetical protein